MNYLYPAITQLLMLADTTLLLIEGRTVFAMLLVAVQFYVLRAMLRIIRSMQLIPRKEKLLTGDFACGRQRPVDSKLGGQREQLRKLRSRSDRT